MRQAGLSTLFRRCRIWLLRGRARGHVALYMAVLLTGLMGLAGAGVDYGQGVIESARLQNAVDAAALAGARAMITSSASTQTARRAEGTAATNSFLLLHGYTHGVNGASFTLTPSASDGGIYDDTMQISATVVKNTSFWKVIGINTTTLTRSASALASGGMVDVMLSLDLSKSMDVGGSDLTNLRSAVVAFINQMQIDAANPRGTQLGIARWAGTKCSWWRGISTTPNTNNGADADTLIDFGIGPPNTGLFSTRREYTQPCVEDATIISGLTMNKANLIKIADNSGAGTCPTGMAAYACPLVSWNFGISQIPVAYGTPTTATGTQMNNSVSYTWSGITGTRLPAAINVTSNGSYYAWSTANGGRNDAATTGIARKVLVIMTDGFSQAPADLPSGGLDPSGWDAAAITAANTLKLGPNGIAGDWDDVEIYTVGFFCTPYDTNTAANNWCRSKAAATGTVAAKTHPCPAATMPGNTVFSYSDGTSVTPGVDQLLNSIASSTPGTCDHYFPIAKSEGSSLPQLFRVVAGSITRGRLQ